MRFIATGPGGGTWDVVAHEDTWSLSVPTPAATPSCSASTAASDALKLFVRDAAAPPLDITGDPDLGEALQHTKAVLG